MLKKSGCCQVTLGIQSLDELIRREAMSRHTSNEVLYEAMNAIQDEESLIHLTGFYIYRKPKRIFFYRLKYFPNTSITKKVQETNELSALASQEILDGKVRGCSTAWKDNPIYY